MSLSVSIYPLNNSVIKITGSKGVLNNRKSLIIPPFIQFELLPFAAGKI